MSRQLSLSETDFVESYSQPNRTLKTVKNRVLNMTSCFFPPDVNNANFAKLLGFYERQSKKSYLAEFRNLSTISLSKGIVVIGVVF